MRVRVWFDDQEEPSVPFVRHRRRMSPLHPAADAFGACGRRGLAIATSGECNTTSTNSDNFIVSGGRMAHPASSSAPAAPQSSLGVPNFDWVHDDIRRHTSEYTSGASIDDLHLQLTEEG